MSDAQNGLPRKTDAPRAPSPALAELDAKIEAAWRRRSMTYFVTGREDNDEMNALRAEREALLREEDASDLIWALQCALSDAADNGDGWPTKDTLLDALAHHGIAIVWVEPQTTFSA